MTSESEPKAQNETERASALSTIEMARPTTALRIADTPMPIITSCIELRASEKTRSVEPSAPIVANTTEPTDPIETTLKKTPRRTPSDAPAEVPIIAGSASGLFAPPCARTPAIASIAPTINAAAIRGARISQMI